MDSIEQMASSPAPIERTYRGRWDGGSRYFRPQRGDATKPQTLLYAGQPLEITAADAARLGPDLVLLDQVGSRLREAVARIPLNVIDPPALVAKIAALEAEITELADTLISYNAAAARAAERGP